MKGGGADRERRETRKGESKGEGQRIDRKNVEKGKRINIRNIRIEKKETKEDRAETKRKDK